MSVNLQMSQAMNVKMAGGGLSRMTNNSQMVPQQQQPQQQQQQQHSQHHHQQQPTPQQHPSMMRAQQQHQQQQQLFTQHQQQQVTMNIGGNPYQRNMGPGYRGTPHQQQQYQQSNTAMQPVTVSNQPSMLNNVNHGLPPRDFSPSDFNFDSDFLDAPLTNDSKNVFNNKQQAFHDFNLDLFNTH